MASRPASTPGSTIRDGKQGRSIAAMGESAGKPRRGSSRGAVPACRPGPTTAALDEQQETHQPAHGIAGQPKDQGRGAIAPRRPDPEPERLARLETHLVKDAPDAQSARVPPEPDRAGRPRPLR